MSRLLPIAPVAPRAKRKLELLNDVREVDEKWRPAYAVWEITLACDLACRHCGSRAGKPRPDELNTEECLDLVDQMAEMGVKEVTVIGGEAYLREDWLTIIRHIRARGMSCSMTTGARSLTKEMIVAARDAGLQGISVSVDGFEETHDKLRAVPGSYKKATEAIATIAAMPGIRVTANTQINRWSLAEIEPLFDKLCELGIEAWQVQITAAMGRAGDEDTMLLEPYDMLEVVPMVARLKQLGDTRGVVVWPGNNIGYFGPHEHTLRGTWPGGHRGACGAGRRTLGIEANGNIKGCPSLPSADYVGGNVRDLKLKDIWERSDELRFMRDHRVTQLKGFCATCYYARECRGGCQWTAHVLIGERGDNPFCHHRALQLHERGERERIVRKAAAPNVPFDYNLYEIVREPLPGSQ